MEKRLLLFFALTFLIVSVWYRVFPPQVAEDLPPSPPEIVERARPDGDETTSTPDPTEDPDERSPEAAPSESTAGMTEAHVAVAERSVVVETSLYDLELTNRGARIASFGLKDYLDSTGNPYEMVGVSAAEHLNILPLDLKVETESATRAAKKALFVTDAPARVRVADGDEAVVTFSWSDGRGLEIEKELTFLGGSYRTGVDISVRRGGEEVPKSVLFGAGVGNEAAESRFVGVDRGIVVSRGEVVLLDADDVDEGDGAGVGVQATGVASHYFAGLMVPTGDGIYGSRLESAIVPTSDPERKERAVITALLESTQSPLKFTLYIGPKELESLEALAPGMSQIIELGSWMRHPALLLRDGLMRIHASVGNFGWAIVLLTVLINVVLVPLKHYSFVSMRKMQKIAPQTQKIRERYKKVKPTDPRYQQMNQEIMALHKEHGVNPLSGCLPMVLMIPFFFAFYRLLMSSIELRQAPFMFWIEDLARHDPFFVLPILMGATQLAIQKMTPTTGGDPVQQKLMSVMPVLFTVFLAWAPSGLVLYWFSNNLFSMAQQSVTNRLLKSRDEQRAEEDKTVQSIRSVKTSKTGKKGKGKRGGYRPAS